jgi:hypothetical protein
MSRPRGVVIQSVAIACRATQDAFPHQRSEDTLADIRLQTEQAPCLWTGQARAWHLFEFATDSSLQCRTSNRVAPIVIDSHEGHSHDSLIL